MQKKHFLSLGFIVAFLVASLLVLNPAARQKEEPTCCKKSLKPCAVEVKDPAPAETPLENLSHQFISLSPSLR